MRARSPFSALADLLLYCSLNCIRPTVPYAIVPTKRTVQILVMINPIGTIKMFKPGTTNGASDATTRVWMGGITWDFVTVTWAAKTPETKVASSEEREVFTFAPVLSVPVRVTVGTRTFWRAALHTLVGFDDQGLLYVRSHVGGQEVLVYLSNESV